MLRVMTPLWGTKHSSALVGDKSGGDGRAARSLLSCVLWRGMGRLWRGMGGGRPPHRQHGLSCSPAVRHFFRSEPGPPTMVFTKHETRNTNHSFPTHDFPPFPTISHHFPRFPGISRPPPTPPLRRSSVHAPSAFLGQPPGLPRRPVTAFLCAVGQLWSGYGAAWAAAVPRTGNTAFPVHRPSDISSGANQASQPWFSRNTRHETRPLCFSRITNHATWFFPVPPATPRRATPSPTNGFFTRHETRNTNHGFFLACCGRRVVRNAG